MMRRFVLFFCLLWIVGGVANAQDPFTGTIDDETPFVEFPLTVTEDGTTTLTVDLHKADGDLDALLYLLDADGTILAHNDDREPGVTDSRIEFAAIPAGDYAIVATRYKVTDGKTSGAFELTIKQEPISLMLPDYDLSEAALTAAGFPALEPRPLAEWTVLAYYGADTNLESGILNDFDEFERGGGSDERVRVVALVDRIPNYSDIDGDWQEIRLYEIAPDGADADNLIDSQPLAELPELDTGDGETLAQFLAWAVRHYPAERYAVAFGSHGAGWEGLITDDTSDKTIISVPELAQAFFLVEQATGVDRFDFLINDACLMSSVEYYAVMGDHFNLSVASPEIVVNPALDMSLFVQALRDERDLVSLGTELVDVYMQRDVAARSASDVAYLNHAVTDLNRFDAVFLAVEDFASLFLQFPERYAVTLGEARANAYTYSAFWGKDSHIDLGSLMQQVRILSDDPALDAAAEAVITALDDVRVYAKGGANVPGQAGYYNIYFPAESAEFDATYVIESPLATWAGMLRVFYNAVTPQVWRYERMDAAAVPQLSFHAPTAPQVDLVSVFPETGSVLRPINIQMEIVGRNIANGQFTADYVQEDGSKVRVQVSPLRYEVVIDGEIYAFNLWTSGPEPGTTIWYPFLTYLSDGTQSNSEFFVIADHTASVDGRYRLDTSSEWNDITVIFDLETGEVSSVIAQNAGNDAVAVVDIPFGAEFQTYQEIVTPDGRTVRSPANVYTWDETAFYVVDRPAPTGTYEVGFLVETYGGTTGFDSIQLSVDNSAADDDLQGYLDVDLGVSIIYPADFSELVFDDVELWWIAESLDGATTMLIYDTSFYALEDYTDVPTAIDAVVNDIGLEITSDAFEPITVDGVEGLAFTFADGDATGRGFGVYNAFVDAVLVFTVSTVDDDLSLLNRTVDLLVEATLLLNVPDTRTWTIEQELNVDADADASVIWPMRQDWMPGVIDAAEQVRYTPPDDAPFTFVSIHEWGDNVPEAAQDLIAAHQDRYFTTADITDTTNETYYGEYLTWEALLYSYQIEDTLIMGRVYATLINGVGYTVWFEAPVEQAADLFANVYEPIIDGFRLQAYDPYADLSTLLEPDELEEIDTDNNDDAGAIDATQTYENDLLGFTLTYPADWGPFVEDAGFYYAEDAVGDYAFYVLPFAGFDDPAEVLDFLLADLNGDLNSDPQTITVDGREGLAVDYTYTVDGDTYYGRGVLVFDESIFVTAVLVLESYQQPIDPALYDFLLENLTFTE